MNEPDGESFGSVLRFFRRREWGMTQAKLAKKLGVHVNSVGLWERGEGVPDSHEYLVTNGASTGRQKSFGG
ncbi:helix-turn-helix domain-containing protein [Ktedonobacter robiniae]|uniref:HTH cro/C1-type domain-containing protein n=1 Tax=Ktedonobacter robiniae TaxID=2778365 RepID=A0ABQ3UY58_9CHLR|nr:helix-turn-helix transcriptional regulator [Ktedonobacter robiniae]GHO57594.1 hypothetical protein KSB_60690 [Ktedonobacter robiniae]